MKKLIVSCILIAAILSCTSFKESWERVERQRKERGHGCYRDPYSKSGHIVCGYRN